MARFRLASGFAPTPFDKVDSVESVWLHDDFVTHGEVTDLVDAAGVAVASELQWQGSELAGGAAATTIMIAGENDHPGILELTTGGTIPADGDAAALSLGDQAGNEALGPLILDTNGVYVAAIVRIPDVSDTRVEFGLVGQTPAAVNSSVADAVNLVWDPEDAANVGDEMFIAQVNGAGTDVEKVHSLSTYVENDWVLLEIAADDTSATFRVTTEDNSQTLTIDGSDGVVIPVVGVRPVFVVEAVGGAEEVLDIDAFHLRYLRRVPPYVVTDGYLGA